VLPVSFEVDADLKSLLIEKQPTDLELLRRDYATGRNSRACWKRVFRCILHALSLYEACMAAENAATMWVPTCCSRVMRFNLFVRADGGFYGALVCTVCSKNIVLEQEPLAAADTYGGGSRVLSVLGAPKPPKTDRHKDRETLSDTSAGEPTL
jgi:hypothetical protein